MVRPDHSAESSTGIFQTHALVGGTVNDGPPRTWFTNVGAGAPIPGDAPPFTVVNYTEVKLSKKDFRIRIANISYGTHLFRKLVGESF
jgi:hypothetical protein